MESSVQRKTSPFAAVLRNGAAAPGAGRDGSTRCPLLELPVELHLQIAEMLTYPDALSLKHTNRHFRSFVDTGVKLKVAWLVERRRLHLDCPSEGRCDLGTDLRFCRGSVALLMKRRREHIECQSRPDLGCIVLGTPTCPHRPAGHQYKRLLGRMAMDEWSTEMMWLLVAMAVVACSWALARCV